MSGLGFLALLFFAVWLQRVAKRSKVLEAQVAQLQNALDALNPQSSNQDLDTASGLEPDEAIAERIEHEAESGISDGEETTGQGSVEPESTDEPAAKPPRRRRSFADIEQMVGARWSVILGSIAIALGALFLVRYSIESGLLGPAARIALGVVVSIALLAGGEWLRRRDKSMSLPVFARADIPGVLTGAGIIAIFGTLYAAHALYGFIGPALAFLGLTLIGLAALALSSVHGPKLAAIGLLGAFAAPLLVDSDSPNSLAILLHILAVTAAALTVARIRRWNWLSISTCVGSIMWALLLGLAPSFEGLFGFALLAGQAVLFVGIMCWQVLPADQPPKDQKISRIACASLIALAFVFVEFAIFGSDFPTLYAGLVLGAIIMATAIHWPSMAVGSFAAALIVVVAGLSNELDLINQPAVLSVDNLANIITPPNILGYATGLLVLGGVVGGIAAFGVWRSNPSAPRMASYIASAFAVMAVLLMLVAYGRISQFEQHFTFGLAAMLFALAFISLCEMTLRQRPNDLKAGAPGAYSVAAIALISFALGAILSSLWWPFGLSLTALGTSWIFGFRSLRALPILAIIVGALSSASIFFSMPFHGVDIGTTPLFNQLIIIVGLPSLAILAGGELLRRSKAGVLSDVLTALGLALFALFVALELRHWLSGGNIASNNFGLDDMAVQCIAALGFSIGLQRVARFTGASIYSWASLVVGIVSVVAILLGLIVVHNPVISNASVGANSIFNSLLPAYFVTGALAAIVAYMARPVRPRWYVVGYALLASALLFCYVTFETRHAFQGSNIGLFRTTTDLEFWTYSAVWLVLGGLLLAVGLFFQSTPLRAASAILIGLTILKVFLLDMTALTGVLRAVSFMGLGLSLIVIGRFYQRILLGTGNAPLQKSDDGDGVAEA